MDDVGQRQQGVNEEKILILCLAREFVMVMLYIKFSVCYIFLLKSLPASLACKWPRRPILLRKPWWKRNCLVSCSRCPKPRHSDIWSKHWRNSRLQLHRYYAILIDYTQCPFSGKCRTCTSKVNAVDGILCYIVHTSPLSWVDASKECEKSGNTLAGVHTEEERDFVKKLFVGEHWLGASWEKDVGFKGYNWFELKEQQSNPYASKSSSCKSPEIQNKVYIAKLSLSFNFV